MARSPKFGYELEGTQEKRQLFQLKRVADECKSPLDIV